MFRAIGMLVVLAISVIAFFNGVPGVPWMCMGLGFFAGGLFETIAEGIDRS